MNPRLTLCAVLVAVATVAGQPAFAHDRDAFDTFSAIAPERIFKGIIREDDVTLLFAHIRESIAASARSEAPRDPDAVNRRADEIGREATKRSAVLMEALLAAFENAAKRAVREGLGDIQRPVPDSR